MSKKQSKLGQNYAWVSSTAGFLSQPVFTMSMTSWGICLISIANTFGMETTDFAIGASLYGALSALLAFVWGVLYDRFGIRKVISASMLGVAAMFFLLGFFGATSPMAAILLYAVAGAFVAGVANTSMAKIIGTWFMAKHRGKGASFVALGGLAGGLTVGIVAPIFISMGDFRTCYIGLAIIYCVLTVIVFALMRDDPASVGTEPFGYKEGDKIEEGSKEKVSFATIVRILKMPVTWKLGIIMIMWQIYLTSFNTYFAASAVQVGFTLAIAGLALSAKNITQAIGGVFFPFLSDYVVRKYALLIQAIGAAALILATYFIVGSGNIQDMILLVCVAAFGFFTSSTPVLVTLQSDCYPRELRGSGPGVVNTIAVVGTFGGPLIAAWLVNTLFGDQLWGFMIMLAVMYLLVGVLGATLLPKTGGKKALDTFAEVDASEEEQKLEAV